MSTSSQQDGGSSSSSGAGRGQHSGYYAAVQRIMSQLRPPTLRQFHRLSTDDERYALVAALPGVRPTLATAVTGSRSAAAGAKSSGDASRHRQTGNELYKAGKLRSALDHYTVSVLLAPVTDCDHCINDNDDDADENDSGSNDVEDGVLDEIERTNSEFVLALGNRSACLLQMKRYDDCLVDVGVALRYGYPRHLRHKLYDRRARSLIELGRFDEALTALRRLHDSLALTRLTDDQRDAIARNADKKIDFCSSAVVQPPAPDPAAAAGEADPSGSAVHRPEVPEISGGQSERFPGASDAFDVRFHEDRGRYGVAGRDVGVGEVLLVESPYVSVLSAEAYETRCFHCFHVVSDVPFSCHTCARVRYCSEDCRKQSWETHHHIECHYLGLLLESRTGMIAHLTLKLMAVTGLGRLLKYRRNPKSSSEALRQSLSTNAAGVFVGGFMSLYGLLSHSDFRSPADLLQYTLLAVWITEILRRTALTGVDEKDVSTVGGVVLRFLQIVACNGVEVTELQSADTLHRCQPGAVGLALYPAVSLLNHSCNPTLEMVFYGNACAVRAVQNATAGRELFIDYGYVYYATKRDERRTALRAQYFFDCQCAACVDYWPLKSALPSGAAVLKCVGCSSPLSAEELAAESVECRRCGRPQEGFAERLEALGTSQTSAEKAIGDARRFRVTRSTTTALEEHLTLIDKYVQLPWKDYVVCLSTLKQCYRYLANREF